jgi:hypothetical protein
MRPSPNLHHFTMFSLVRWVRAFLRADWRAAGLGEELGSYSRRADGVAGFGLEPVRVEFWQSRP